MNPALPYIAFRIREHGFAAWVDFSRGCVKAVMIGTIEGRRVSFMPAEVRSWREAREFLGY